MSIIDRFFEPHHYQAGYLFIPFGIYTLDGAVALRWKLKCFSSGKVVLNIAEFPNKCPIAPLEFVFMAGILKKLTAPAFDIPALRRKLNIQVNRPAKRIDRARRKFGKGSLKLMGAEEWEA